MPELFGTSWALLAIVVVVLLLALLGLAWQRRKQSGASATKADKVTKAPAAKSTRESRKATALATKAAEVVAIEEAAAVEETAVLPQTEETMTGAASAAEAPLVAGAPADSTVQPSPAAPPQDQPLAPEAPAAPTDGRFGLGKRGPKEIPTAPPLISTSADPLQAIITSVLQGWGDVTTEDTNRLAVFRKDKVAAALAALELPKDLKNSEYAKTRLLQLRRYAGSIEQGERPAEPGETEHEFAGMAFAPTAPATAAAPVAPAPKATPAPATPAAPPSPVAAVNPIVAEPAPSPVTPREPAVDPSHAFAVPKDAAESWDAPTKWTEVKVAPKSKDPWDAEEEESASEERAAEFDWGSEEDHIPPTSIDLKSADLTWNGEPAVSAPSDKPQQPLMAEPLGTFDPSAWDKPAETPQPAPASTAPAPSAVVAEPPKPAQTDAEEAHRTAEAAVAAAAAAFWNMPDAPIMEQAVSPSKADTSCAAPFSGLSMKVSTAADIMALPMSERADMLAFLAPAELSKVFVLAADKDLKKSVIETLEHIGNTCALDALRECLEDPDPEIQLYALEAADRMLGTAS